MAIQKKENWFSRLKKKFSKEKPINIETKVEEEIPVPYTEEEPVFEEGRTTLLVTNEREEYKKKQKTVLLTMILNGDSKQYVVSDFPCILGRSPQEATIVLDDSGVSRKHAVIDLDNNQIFITDINSRNGVFLNKSRIKPETAQEIASGDTIKIGRVEIRIE